DGVREECARMLSEARKTQRRRDFVEDLRQDVSFAVRSALNAPMFTALAVVTLALGIGANAAVFGVVKSVLLNSLPYANAGELARIKSPIKAFVGEDRGALSAGTVSDFRERQKSFISSGAWDSPRDMIYNPGSQPQIVKALWVEPSLFTTLGVKPILGSLYTDADGLRDTSFNIMIPWKTWQAAFGGAPDVVGKTVQLNGINRTIVGVLPRGFVMPEEDADYFMPFNIIPWMRDPISVRGSHNFGMVARLRPGVSIDAADREMRAIGDELEKLYAKDNFGIGLKAQSLREAMVGDTKTPLLVLLASAGLVLLITCANLAGALLSRTISRRKEFAVRIALGAGRGRLVRQLLTESVLLAVAGAVAGVLLAVLLLGGLRGLALEAIPTYADLTLDAGAIAVTFVIALLTGIAFGLGPALAVGRADPQKTLRDETRGSTESVRSRRMRGVLVAGQIALCVSLLAAAGLLGRSLWKMTHAPMGFDAESVLTFRMQLPNAKYGAPAARLAFKNELEQRLRALPGVKNVALTGGLPSRIGNSNGIFIQSRPWGANEPVPFITTARVTDDFFRTMEIPLVAGRTFSSTDVDGATPVMVITEAFAKKYFPKGDALGQQIRYGPPNPNQPWTTIIGVVGSVRNNPLALTPEPMMFFSQRQQPFGEIVVLRTTRDPKSLTSAVRSTLRSIDPGLPMYEIKTMEEVVSEGFAARRLPVLLMGAFGVLALLLASVGVYAMFTSMAAAREREFGVRIALGGTRSSVAGLVLRQGGQWMIAGLAIGGIGIFVAARLVSSQLHGVAAFDPWTIGAAVLVLLVCAGIALLVPVRRATRVDPITVLR
ncbi:MAG TPA: ABC transporter permease, partial [Gemmatimonadaceae bacterium]|nr:ABC transporter permease [Gemmatimonadaceae bacterium]